MEKEAQNFIFIQPDKTILIGYKPENISGWEVKGTLMEKILATPCFDLVIENNQLVDIAPKETPVISQSPSETDKINAKIDYIALMAEVDISGLV